MYAPPDKILNTLLQVTDKNIVVRLFYVSVNYISYFLIFVFLAVRFIRCNVNNNNLEGEKKKSSRCILKKKTLETHL